MPWIAAIKPLNGWGTDCQTFMAEFPTKTAAVGFAKEMSEKYDFDWSVAEVQVTGRGKRERERA